MVNVTWSVLKESNTHIAKRALEASTDARSPECTEEPAHFCTIEMHSSQRFHCTAMRNTRFTDVTATL